MSFLTGAPPRVLVVVNCVIWSAFVFLSSVGYTIWLLSGSGSEFRIVKYNALIIATSALLQGVASFHYLRKYLGFGIKNGWLAMSSRAASEAPRVSIAVWALSTLTLLITLAWQVMALSGLKSNTNVTVGWFIVGMQIMTLLGIGGGFLISSFCGGDNNQEDDKETEQAAIIGSASLGDASPVKRRKN